MMTANNKCETLNNPEQGNYIHYTRPFGSPFGVTIHVFQANWSETHIQSQSFHV